MKKFNEIKYKYQIMAFDYITKKEYVYEKTFDTYDEAMDSIPNIEPPSKACGFSINEIPSLDFSLVGGPKNANFKG